MPLPLAIDAQAIRQDLLRWGWNDYKIEAAIGASAGYMAKLADRRNIGYSMTARLFNLWEFERDRRANTASSQSFSTTLATV